MTADRRGRRARVQVTAGDRPAGAVDPVLVDVRDAVAQVDREDRPAPRRRRPAAPWPGRERRRPAAPASPPPGISAWTRPARPAGPRSLQNRSALVVRLRAEGPDARPDTQVLAMSGLLRRNRSRLRG